MVIKKFCSNLLLFAAVFHSVLHTCVCQGFIYHEVSSHDGRFFKYYSLGQRRGLSFMSSSRQCMDDGGELARVPIGDEATYGGFINMADRPDGMSMGAEGTWVNSEDSTVISASGKKALKNLMAQMPGKFPKGSHSLKRLKNCVFVGS